MKRRLGRAGWGIGIFAAVFFIAAQNPASQENRAAQQITWPPTYEPAAKLGNDGQSVILTYTSRVLLPGGVFDKGDIFYQRLNADGSPSGGSVRVTSGSTDNTFNDTSGDFIVFTAYDRKDSPSGNIVLFRVSTGASVILGSAEAIQGPRISNGKVVWVQGAPRRVMLADIEAVATGLPAQAIGGPSPLIPFVDIGERFAVWAEDRAGQFDLVAYDLTAHTRTAVTATPTASEINPATSGPWIVWQEIPVGVADPPFRILARNMDTGESKVVAETGTNSKPSIDGDFVAYESDVSGDRNVFVRKLSTGQTFQVTSEPGEQYCADISGSLVAYVDLGLGSENIVVRDLISISGTPTIDMTAMAVLAASPGGGGSSGANLDQGSNGTAAAPVSPVEWQNGNLNENNAHLMEGFSVPYRVVMTGMPVGDSVTIVIGYDVMNSGKHAIDYLTRYDWLEPHAGFGHPAEAVDPVVDLPAFSGEIPGTFPIPTPTPEGSILVSGVLQPFTQFTTSPPDKYMSIWGGTITGIAYGVEGDLLASQSETTLEITFNTSNSTVVLAWGGHIAQSIIWGDGQAATGIQGSPYHMRLKDWSLGNLGNQDRSLKSFAVVATGTIIVNKVAVGGDDTFDYTVTGAGLANFQLTTPGSATQTFSGLVAGTAGGSRSITEVVPEGWTLDNISISSALGTSTFSTANSTATVTSLAPNDTVTITYTDKRLGAIRVVKNTIPSPDGQDFAFTGTSDQTTLIPTFSLDDDEDPVLSDTKLISNLKPGNYTITEGAVAGYELTGIAGADSFDLGTREATIALAAGEEVTVTFTNTKLGKITVVKDTVPNDAQDFSFTSDHPTAIPGFSLDDDSDSTLSNTKIIENLKPGIYTITEAAVSGFNLTGIGGADSFDLETRTATIDLAAGEEITVTFTNTKLAKITVVKDTIPNDGQDFSFTSDHPTEIPGFSLDDDSDPTLSNTKVISDLEPGTYTISEDPVEGFELTGIAGADSSNLATRTASITLEAGEEVTVTFTNTKLAKITVVKDTVPDDPQNFHFKGTSDQTTLIPDFYLDDDSDPALSNTNAISNLKPGNYTITEDPVTGFDLTAITGADSFDLGTRTASITLEAGEEVTVTFTNTKQATLTIVKDTVPSPDGQDFSFTSGQPTEIPGFSLDDDEDETLSNTKVISNLPPGAYSVTEGAQEGYDLTAITGADSSDLGTRTASITLTAGEDAVITFTNTKRATLTIVKDTVPSPDGQDFSFTSGQPTAIPGFSLDDDDDPTLSNTKVVSNLVPGAYSVTEGAVEGYDLTAIAGADSSDLGTRTASITLAAGEEATITFTNTKRATLTIVKDTVPSPDGQDFAYTGSTEQATGIPGFSLDDDDDPILPNTKLFSNLLPGNYTIIEGAVAGYDLTGIQGADGAVLATGTATIAMGPGEEATITFTNTKRAHVTLVKTETVGGVTGSPTTWYTFVLTGGPDGVNITRDTSSGGSLDFGLLKPGGGYCLTEVAVPAGTASTLQTSYGGTPNSPNPGDITLCDITLAAGEERVFEIDNSRPGGGTRTIGYWKNWNSVSHDGSFVARAALTGNYLLDDFLPYITLGVFSGNLSVETAVAILDKTSTDGTKRANDAAYALASQLLAAMLNVQAGAGHSAFIDGVIAEAQTLLYEAGFNATGEYWKGGRNAAADRQTALNLAATLDAYNNGTIP